MEHMTQCKGCAPNLYTYGILIDGFTKAGDTKKAPELFLKNEIISEKFIFETLTIGLCKIGKLTWL